MDKYMNFLAKDITFRDYFAAKALQGIISSQRNNHFSDAVEVTVKDAYEYADAMLKERQKGNQNERD